MTKNKLSNIAFLISVSTNFPVAALIITGLIYNQPSLMIPLILIQVGCFAIITYVFILNLKYFNTKGK